MSSVSVSGTLYIKSISGTVSYSTDQSSYTTIVFPLTITNVDAGTSTLVVLFESDITLTDVNSYFICGSTDIQFGSKTLGTGGSRPIITISGSIVYPGLVRNSDAAGSVAGYNNITIVNLVISSAIGNTLANYGGWFGQEFFGQGASNNRIINCSTDGSITNAGCGGIVGGYAGRKIGGVAGQLIVIGCSASGSTANTVQSGGICGGFIAASGGSVTVSQCWFTGTIASTCGGIVGSYAANSGGTVIIRDCYATPSIGSTGGGICAINAGNAGTVDIRRCYTFGDIALSAGGIVGQNSASSSGTVIITNCYTTGNITSGGGGIFGAGYGLSTTATRCYVSGTTARSLDYIFSGSATIGATNYSEAGSAGGTPGSWSDTHASSTLVNDASGGTTWSSIQVNTPYVLSYFGPTQYSLEVVNAEGTFVQTYEPSITAGQSTDGAIVASGYTFLGLYNSEATITVDSVTGVISTTAATPEGSYTLLVIKYQDAGGFFYNNYSTLVSLTVTAAATVTTSEIFTLDLVGLNNPTYETLNELRTGAAVLEEKRVNSNLRFNSFREYAYYLQAQASVRPS